jgi:DNA-binding transcriptional LysR family regulator
MAATPRTLAILESVRAVLELVDHRIIPPAQFIAAEAASPVRLALSDIGEIVFLPKVLQLLRDRMPLAPVHSLTPLAEAVGRDLETGRIDLALGYFPDLRGDAYRQQVLFHDSFSCLIRSDHPIRSERLTMDQFRSMEHAVVQAEGRTEEVVERFLAKRRIERRIALTTPHFASIPLLISQSDLIATVPEPLALHCAAISSNVRIVGLPFRPPTIALKQLWHRRYHVDARNQWLRAHIFQLFEGRRAR